MSCNILMAVRITDRESQAVRVQGVLTEHGCGISMRLGLHDPEEGSVCSMAGILILQLCCSSGEAKVIEADIAKIPGVKVKFLDLD